MTAALQLVPDTAPVQLISAQQIAERFFSGNVSAEWVRTHVPGKRKYGHRTVLWAEAEVRAWVLSRGR